MMTAKLKKIDKLKVDLEDRAQKIGLMDDFVFVNLWDGYQSQLSLCHELLNVISADGYTVIMPAGKDQTKKVINPAVAEYNRIATLANKTAAQLTGMLEKAIKENPEIKPEDDAL